MFRTFTYISYIFPQLLIFLSLLWLKKKGGLQLNNKLAYDEFIPISILEQKLLAYSS